jgi:hypothetical protein
MPKTGYKSITVSDVVYEYFEQIYRKNKTALALQGINSFSGFCVWIMSSVTDQKEIDKLTFVKALLKLPKK